MNNMIYQFKVLLQGIKPSIWRRIQVPDSYSFYDLHVAIQDSMGWEDYHLHEFNIENPKNLSKDFIGLPNEEWADFEDRSILASWQTKISDYFSQENLIAEYMYDFGDGWEHLVTLEKIFPARKNMRYPRCTHGERACPPEDCGGIGGYNNLLEVLADPHHEEYESLLKWLGGDFDATKFSPEEVIFENPRKRLTLFLQDES